MFVYDMCANEGPVCEDKHDPVPTPKKNPRLSFSFKRAIYIAVTFATNKEKKPKQQEREMKHG